MRTAASSKVSQVTVSQPRLALLREEEERVFLSLVVLSGVGLCLGELFIYCRLTTGSGPGFFLCYHIFHSPWRGCSCFFALLPACW